MDSADNIFAFHNETETEASHAFLADLYRFLALCFRYPERRFCDRNFFASFLALVHHFQLQEEYELVERWLHDDPVPLENLQIEYTRLFINSVPHVPAPPYASVYLDGDNTLQGKTTEKIRDYYRSCGFDIVDPSLPADHLALQLEFLAQLADEERLDREEFFISRYFRPWYTRFAHRVLTATEHPFYRVSVQLTDLMTKEEQ